MNRDSKGAPTLPPSEPSPPKTASPPSDKKHASSPRLKEDPNTESNKPGNKNPTTPGAGKTLSELGNPNRSQLGDPTSLRAEYTDTHPTENDLGAKGVDPTSDKDTSKSEGSGGSKASAGQGTGKSAQKESNGKAGNERTGGPEGKGSLKDAAMKNPTAMGDPVSLKAEKSDSEPTEHDRGHKGGAGKSKL